MMNLFYGAGRFFLRSFFAIFCRIEVVNPDKVPPRGSVVLASNHVSYLDPLVILASLKRRPTFMAKESLFSVPMIGILVRTFSFPVRRGRPRPSTVRKALERLKCGGLIVIFPEGGLSADGSRLGAKRGVGMIAAMAGACIVPVCLDGTERALPVGARCVRPAKITVTFGDPIEVRRSEAGKGFHERVTQDVMGVIEKLRRGQGGALRGHRPVASG